MSLFNIFNLSGSSLSTQSQYLNTTAQNIANSGLIASSEAEAYRSRIPVFAAVLDEELGAGQTSGVRIVGTLASQDPIQREYLPQHPDADPEGFVYHSNVNVVEEMSNMIVSSRAYQSNVDVMNSAKQLLLRTLSIGRS
jgi:flagellar basal-body rod protein FlgC